MVFDFNWSWNLPEIILQIISYVLIISLLLIIYKKQSEKPHIGKAVLAAMVGIFSFSFNFQFQGYSVSLAILPLGVGVLYFFIKRRNEERWRVYRRYAWLGFLANYVFLLTGLLTPLVFNLMYDKSDPATYLAQTDDAAVHLTHESADQRNLHNERLETELENAQVKEFDSMRWHRQIEDQEEKERFPYILSGFESKSGSDLNAVTFVEKDGKGLLIQTAEDQLYVRTEQSVLKEGE
ncbi:hypothetical protein GCM10010954_25750 [Halobacillus andaensis]|uniref:Uncharacterized protein n=1 Tax=Halobacillus andaensis TaxID=1176239 RepID=A0A917B5U9_HALAA|nr:hypothetical protein [Halobacillus andaensis]MBP2005839.1 hypothetical protein [Halobacillus andaensis]GGF25696.1 hypothetical protein GCM10010954_25750 [Halobacillus andaensis]